MREIVFIMRLRSGSSLVMKKAFSLIELIFVLIIIGVLSAIMLPSIKTNPLDEAAIQLLTHIRYTQHLAMIDDRYNVDRIDSNNGDIIWYKERWQLVFSKSDFTDNEEAYTIFSDTAGNSTGDASASEIAINPQNTNQIMTGGYGETKAIDIRDKDGFKGMQSLNIGKKYGISEVTLSGGCSHNRISFDYLGRPFTGKQSSMHSPYNIGGTQRLIHTDEGCKITLTHSSGKTVSLKIRRETGFTCILQDTSEECQ